MTYNGDANAPTNPGSYDVVATIAESNYSGSASGTLVVVTTVFVRHAPILIGGIDGSLQVASPEDVALAGRAWISGDLIVPGMPGVLTNGTPTLVGLREGAGSPTPATHQVTLSGAATVRYIVRRVDPVSFPTVATPPAPTGTRDVVIATAQHLPTDWSVVRDIAIVGDAGDISVPPGTFGELRVNGTSNVVLGDSSATQPVVYSLQRLNIGANTALKIVGSVALTVAEGIVIAGNAGDAAQPQKLVLRLASGDFVLSGNATVAAHVIAPTGTVNIGAGKLTGAITADNVAIGGSGLVEQPRE
jgi:hypothetical protein